MLAGRLPGETRYKSCMQAMVLAAGLGTRLRPLTDELPKPLVFIGDRPMLQVILEALARAGATRVVINAHHRADDIHAFVVGYGDTVKVIDEVEIRGTAGGIAGARGLFAPGPVLVWNADILVEPPVGPLLKETERASLVLGVVGRPKGEGTVGIGADGEVVRLRGQQFGVEERGGDYVGVAALAERAWRRLPERGCLIGDYALPELRQGGRITAVAAPEFNDVGTLPAYLAANLAWLGEARRWIAEDAQIAPEVELERCVVGAGATVIGTGRLRECVVWPGATAQAPLTRAVVTRNQVVPVDTGAK